MIFDIIQLIVSFVIISLFTIYHMHFKAKQRPFEWKEFVEVVKMFMDDGFMYSLIAGTIGIGYLIGKV